MNKACHVGVRRGAMHVFGMRCSAHAAAVCDMTRWHATWLVDMCYDSLRCDMTHGHVPWLIDMWHDSLIYAWLVGMCRDSLSCGMTRSCVTWLPPSYVTWLIHMSHDWFVCDIRCRMSSRTKSFLESIGCRTRPLKTSGYPPGLTQMGTNEKCTLVRSSWYKSNKRVYTGSNTCSQEAFWAVC